MNFLNTLFIFYFETHLRPPPESGKNQNVDKEARRAEIKSKWQRHSRGKDQKVRRGEHE